MSEKPVAVTQRGAEPLRQPWGAFLFALSDFDRHVDVVEGRLPQPSSTNAEVVLPDGFQRAEYLKDHGMVDAVVHRHDMKATVARLAGLFGKAPAEAA